jgi:hypothetical protein
MRGNAHAGRSLLLTIGLNGGILWTVLVAVTRAFWYCLQYTFRVQSAPQNIDAHMLQSGDALQTEQQQANEIADNGESLLSEPRLQPLQH